MAYGVFFIEVFFCDVDKAGEDEGAKIHHQADDQAAERHIAGAASCRGKEADDLVRPDVSASEFDCVFKRRVAVEDVDRCSDQVAVGSDKLRFEFLDGWVFIACPTIAEREGGLAEVDELSVYSLRFEPCRGLFCEDVAEALRAETGREDEVAL